MKHSPIFALPVGLVASIASIAAIAACSAADGDVVLGKGQFTGTGGDQQAGYTGGTTSFGGATSAGGFVDFPGSGKTGGSPGEQICQSVAYDAEHLPTDVYVMLDQSSSMGESLPPPSTGTWWSAAQHALESLVTDPGLAGVALGLQFFPLNGVAPGSCNADYATPEVPLAALPGNAAALVAAIQAHQPTTFTPTGPALAGAIAHMKARATGAPGHGLSVVFVTDGFPTECEPQQIQDIAEIARQGYESEARVSTYVIGLNLGAGAENLNLIAQAGGTTQATLIDGSTDVAGTLADAMRMGTRTSNQCRFVIPEPPAGEPLDVSKIGVQYQAPAGQIAAISNVLGEADCGGQQNPGFYFVGSKNGVEAVLCPRTCTEVQPGTVTIVFGCAR